MVPGEASDKAPCDDTDHGTSDNEGPDDAKKAHVAVLVALVGLGVARGSPEKLNVEETVLDSGEVGVALDRHGMLHVETIFGLGPATHEDDTV